MAHPILMPKAGQSMTEGRIVTWLKKEGETVERGDVLLEIETDKANMEVEADAGGVLRRILVPEGESCPVLKVIGVIGGAGEEIGPSELEALEARHPGESVPAPEGPPPAKAPVPESGAPPAVHAATPGADAGRIPVPAAIDLAAPAGLPRQPPLDRDGRRIFASPLARRLARELGVDLESLRGTGPRGRILGRDVETAPRVVLGLAAAAPLLAEARPCPPPSPRPPASVALEGMRGAIARALSQSKSTIPHFYVTAAIDMTAALALKESRERHGLKITVNDLVLRACVLALADEPGVNCRVHADRIEYPEEIHLGIAVGSDQGLVVPVLVDAHGLDLAGIARESRRVISLAQEGKLVGMGRGTFTVSNLGMYGVESFTAIINPPEGAILAVGAVTPQLVPAGGGFFPRSVMRVTLSADHRAVDGLLAARFLARVRHFLEAGLERF